MDEIPNYGDPASYDTTVHYPRPPSPPSGQYDESEGTIEEGPEEDEQSLVTPPLWQQITDEYEEGRRLYAEAKKLVSTDVAVPSDYDRASAYTIREIFPTLLPAMEATLVQAREWDCLRIQKCRFSGLDYIAEVLWNKNPHHDRSPWLDIYNIPFAKEWLKTNPRPLFPMSWLWTPEEAALIIQSAVRAFLVRKRDEVQEMRQFWKILAKERKEAEEQRIKEEKAQKEAELQQVTEEVKEMLSKEVLGQALSIERIKDERKQEIMEMLEIDTLNRVFSMTEKRYLQAADGSASQQETEASFDDTLAEQNETTSNDASLGRVSSTRQWAKSYCKQ